MNDPWVVFAFFLLVFKATCLALLIQLAIR